MDAMLCQHLRELELRLLQPAVRRSPQALAELLDPHCLEYGASGARYSREQLIAGLVAETGFTCVADGFEFQALAPDVVQLRYVSSVRRGDEPAQCARRSSLWRYDEAGWRLLFHQATPIADY